MYNATNQAFLFKETWSEISKNHYNSDTPLLARTKKSYNLQGVKDHVAIPMGEAGGIGGLVNGYLPEGGSESGGVIEITAKDVVGVAIIDRKAMKQASTDRGAFVRMTQRPVQMCVQAYDTMSNIILHGDGTGRLGVTGTTGYVSGGATAPVIQMDTATFFERWFPKNFQINIGNSGDTGVEDAVYKIASVNSTLMQVTLTRISGTYDLSSGTNANSRYVYIQNMFKAAPMGLKGAVKDFTSSTLYNLTYDAQNWGALLYNASSAPPSVTMLNYVCNQQMTRVAADDLPTFWLCSPEVWAILSDIMEPDKRVMLSPRDKNLTIEAGFGFAALAYTGPNGKVMKIVADKHCPKDTMYGINDNFMEMVHLPDHGWWDEDGKVFLRVPNRPWYSATYGGYWECVIHPTFQICIYGLATT